MTYPHVSILDRSSGELICRMLSSALTVSKGDLIEYEGVSYTVIAVKTVIDEHPAPPLGTSGWLSIEQIIYV